MKRLALPALLLALILAVSITATAQQNNVPSQTPAAAPAVATPQQNIQPAPATAQTQKSAVPTTPKDLDKVLDGFDTKEKYDRARPAVPTVDTGVNVLYIFRVIFSLVVIIALIIMTIFILRQVYAKSMRLDLRGHHIHVIDVVQMGVNRAVFLVRVGDKILLLGTAEKGLTYLADVTDAVDIEEPGEEELPPPGLQAIGANFRRQFNEALGIRKKSIPPKDQEKFSSGLRERLVKLDDTGEEKEK